MSCFKALPDINQIDILPLARVIALLYPAFLIRGPAYADIAGSTLAALFLIHCFLKRDWFFFQERWVKWALCLWALQLASVLWATDPGRAFVTAIGWGRFFLFGAALAYWVLPSGKMLRHFFFVMMLCLTFLSVDGLYQHVTGTDILGHKTYNQYANTDNAGHEKVGDRLTGPFNKPILGSVIMYFLFPALLLAIYAPDIWRRALYTALSLCAMSTVALSGERSQLLLLVVGLSLAGSFLIWKQQWKRLFATVTGVVGVVVLALLLSKHYGPTAFDYIKNRQLLSTWETLRNVDDSAYGRIWKDSLALITRHPLLGVGEGNVRVHWCDLKEQVYFTEGCPLHPHNVYLEMATNTGVVGLSVYLLMLAALIHYFWRYRFVWRDDPLLAGIVITFLVRVWPLITVTSYTRAISSQSFWLIVGWGIAVISSRLLEANVKHPSL